MIRLDATTFKSITGNFDTEIGDAKQADFLPQFKLKTDGNKFNFSKRLLGHGVGTHSVDGDKVIWSSSDVGCIYCEVDGGFDFATILKSKPKTNELKYSLQTKGVQLSKQSNPTGKPSARQIVKNGVEGVEWDDDLGTNFMEMNHINSIQATRENANGMPPHMFIIYRVKATDSAGAWAWCDQDIAGNVLTKTIPQDFLDTAVFPVEVK